MRKWLTGLRLAWFSGTRIPCPGLNTSAPALRALVLDALHSRDDRPSGPTRADVGKPHSGSCQRRRACASIPWSVLRRLRAAIQKVCHAASSNASMANRSMRVEGI